MPTTQIPAITLADDRTIPQLGYGTLALAPDRESTAENAQITAQVVARALEAGYRHIDTAQAYGTEHGVGRAIADSGIAHDEIFITSKLSNAHHAVDDVKRSFEQTLTLLGVEQLDLFLIHWPLPTRRGDRYVATWTAMTELVSDGRLRSAGVSNFQPGQLDRIIQQTGVVPAVNQVEIHPYFANPAVREACARHGIAVEAHSPLGHDNAELDDETIRQIAATHDKSPAQVLLRWQMQHGIIAIPKSAKPERMAENLDIFDFELSSEDVAAIDSLDRGVDGRVGPDPDNYEGV